MRNWTAGWRQRWSGSPRAPETSVDEPVVEPVPDDVPRVCIVTPVFNGADYIDETIQSVLSQSGNFVLHYHIQDGGSTDDTMARVEQWMRAGQVMPRRCREIVFTCASERDAGMYDAINKGFARALPPGDDVVMGWIGADDLIAPGAFAAILAICAQHPDIRLLGGRISLIDQQGSILGVNPLLPFAQLCMAAGLHDGRALNFIMQEGTFWRSDLWHKIGGLDARFRLAGDWDLWRRMARHESYFSADTILGFHRKRPGQLSEQMDRYFAEVDRMLDGHMPNGGPTDDHAHDDAAPAPLRQAYEATGLAYELIKRDPSRFRGSRYAARGVRHDLGNGRWTRVESIGLTPGRADLVTPAGMTESVLVRATRGFRTADGPQPEHALPTASRWMEARWAEGELLLERAGRYRILLRCRSWAPGQSVVIHADGQPLGRMPITPHEHDQDVIIAVEATLLAGTHTLAIEIEQPAHDTRYLLVTGWWAERQVGDDRATIVPVPSAPIGLAGRAQGPLEIAWPSISLVVLSSNRGHLLRDTLSSICRQAYPRLELLVVDAQSADQSGFVLREFASHIDRLIEVADEGPIAAIETGLRHASGAVVGWLEAGDLLAEAGLHAIALAFLHGDSDIVAGAVEAFDDRGLPLHRRLPCLPNRSLALGRLSDDERGGLRDWFGCPPALFLTRAVWNRAADRESAASGETILTRMAGAGATMRTIGAVVAQSRRALAGPAAEPGRELRTKLRVLFFSDGSPGAGTAAAQRRLAECLVALGHSVTVLAYADLGSGSPERAIDAEAVADAIVALAPDLLVVGAIDCMPGASDFLEALASRDVATIVVADDRQGGDLAHQRLPAGRFAVLAPECQQQRGPHDLADSENPRAHAWPVGIDTHLFVGGDRWRARMLLDLPQGAFIVAAAAEDSGGQSEAFGLLIDALCLLDDPRELVLLVIGNAPPTGHLPFPVRATGTLADEALVAFHYQAIDLFVSLGEDRSAGEPVLKAGASEVPCVAFGTSADDARVLDGLTGMLVGERTSAALAAGIAAMRANPGLRRQMGVQARLHVANSFSLEASAAAITSILALNTGLDLALVQDVKVATDRPVLPRSRYLVEVDGTPDLHDASWSRIDKGSDRADAARCFRSTLSDEAVSLVAAAASGGHTLQMAVRTSTRQPHVLVSVNGESPLSRMVSGHCGHGSQTVQLAADLVKGFNRVVVTLVPSQLDDEPSQAQALWIEELKVWPGVPLSAEGLPDGELGLLDGFEPLEGPYPEHNLPDPIRWSRRRCAVRLISTASGPRRYELAVRNNRANQAIRVWFNNRLVLSRTIEDLPLDVVTRIAFEADVLAGANLVTMEADQVLESLVDTRPIAFVLVDLRAHEGEQPVYRDGILWELSRGLGEANELETRHGAMMVRRVEQQQCTIVVERERAGTARVLIEAVSALPAQTASLCVNGSESSVLGLSTGARGDVLRIEREVMLIAGHNLLQLRFDIPAQPDGDHARALLFIGDVRIESASTVAHVVSPELASA